ncbi:MAG: HAMP domain-containing histidine kinase [Phycisphaerales bacterium]|nr:HAMP domain-containing histidine kinase [Phycisphaerales bacterium]
MSQDNTNDANKNPTPERKVVSPPMRATKPLPPRDPSAGPDSADHLTTLAHDLSNLLDGSMRWLSLAVGSMDTDAPDPNEQLDSAREQINTVQATLHRMSTMVNAAMRSGSVGINSPMLGVSQAITLAQAIDHAVDVVGPLAMQAGVRLEMNIDQDAGTIAAGPLYTVVLNALFNSVQSIQKATQTDALDPGGLIQINAAVDTKHDELVVTITDDGIGLPPSTHPETPFKHTKDNGMGLSIARQIIDQLEGIITLTNRPAESTSTSKRPGAILTLRVPVPHQDSDPGDQFIG